MYRYTGSSSIVINPKEMNTETEQGQSYTRHTLYFYKDDLLGCNMLRHKYTHHSSISLLLRDLGEEKIDISMNNLEFLVHPDDHEKAKALLNS